MADLVDRFAAVADAVELQPLHESPGLLATSAPTGFAPGDRPLVEAQMAAVTARHPAMANDFYRSFARFLFEPESMHDVAVDHCLPLIFNTLTIREDGACRICRYPLGESIHEKSLAEIWNGPARWALYASLAKDGCGSPCWLRCHTHPSPTPGRLLRRVLAAHA